MALSHDAPLGETPAPCGGLPEQSASSPEVPVSPSADSPAPASAKLVLGLAFAQFGAYLAVLTPVMVTLALRVAQIMPEAGRGAALGRVLSVGALLAMLGTPVFGALSDRTTGRFGRRRPWLAGGMVAGFAGLLIVAFGGDVLTLMLGWALAQLGINATLAALTSCIPDLVPDHQRARVSGIVGMMLSLSMVAGSALANVFSGALVMAFLVPGVVGVAGVGCLVAVMREHDRPARAGTFEPYGVKEFARSFWVNPRRHPDFAWNFAGRFLLFSGLSCVTSYSVYFLMDRLGYDEKEAAGKLFVGTLVMVAATVLASILGGQLSDRSGLRKPYVLGSALGMAASLAVLSMAHSFPLYLFAMVVFGCSKGLYLSVDMALAAVVLPNPHESAKDMGVLNIANAFPQSLVPIIAPMFLSIGGGSGHYGALFLFGALASVLGALAVQFVRSVK